MSILIKGMEMPKNCMLCPLCVEEADPANGEMCMVTGTLMPPCTRERLDSCPLLPVPPHGRLIDASEKIRVQIYDDMTEDFHMVDMTIDDLLSQGWIEANAPTIIPAEEGE